MLDFSWKKLDEVPTIDLLVEELNLGNNSISKIPSFFTTLNSLHTVDLSNNAIVVLPTMPRSLRILNLSGNRLTESAVNDMLLKSCKSTWNLEKLWLANNDLKEFPIDIAKLLNLDFLSLANNRIKDIPIQIKALEKLKYMGLSDNLISDAESVLMLLPQLLGLGISGNPLKDPEIQTHRMRHKIRVVRVSPAKSLIEPVKETIPEKLEVQLSRKGTKLLKKKGVGKRPMTLAGLPSFAGSPDENGNTPILENKIIEEEDGESPEKFGSPNFYKGRMKTVASMTVSDYRDNIDNLVDYYFNSEDSNLDSTETPHRVEMTKRHSRIVSDGRKRLNLVKKSKSENSLSDPVQVTFTDEPITIVPKNPEFPTIQIDGE